jgi:hypothetical protein
VRRPLTFFAVVASRLDGLAGASATGAGVGVRLPRTMARPAAVYVRIMLVRVGMAIWRRDFHTDITGDNQ